MRWDDDWRDSLPPISYFTENGIMFSGLVNYALARIGVLQPSEGYGTGNYLDAFGEIYGFDASAPGIPGAAALVPYAGSDASSQGHIALYYSEHGLIQALIFSGNQPGVVDIYTDIETASWGVDTAFTHYGHLCGVDYTQYGGPDLSAS
jgi:hypothetical protein